MIILVKFLEKKSASIILNHISNNNYHDKPTVVMGDLNANPDESPIKLLSEQLEDSFKKLPIKDPLEHSVVLICEVNYQIG